jgi:hypothetical protein
MGRPKPSSSRYSGREKSPLRGRHYRRRVEGGERARDDQDGDEHEAEPEVLLGDLILHERRRLLLGAQEVEQRALEHLHEDEQGGDRDEAR